MPGGPNMDLVIKIGGKLDRYMYTSDTYDRLLKHHRDARKYFPTEADWDALHHLRSGDHNDILDAMMEMCVALAEIRTSGTKLKILKARKRLDTIRYELRQAFYADAIRQVTASAKPTRPRLFLVKG